MKLHLTQSYGTLAIWDHTVLPATRHKWTHPSQWPAGTWFAYPRGMEGWVDRKSLVTDTWQLMHQWLEELSESLNHVHL